MSFVALCLPLVLLPLLPPFSPYTPICFFPCAENINARTRTNINRTPSALLVPLRPSAPSHHSSYTFLSELFLSLSPLVSAFSPGLPRPFIDLRHALALHGLRVAAFLVEPVQGKAG
ncbi:hypothetical protein K438DRAFT_1967928 [Mycena galopus ATCC 62051]|nr:hypothetical protein K438DRAFT_1967928 [Mycena galopus ATCC 62051]